MREGGGRSSPVLEETSLRWRLMVGFEVGHKGRGRSFFKVKGRGLLAYLPL